MPTRPSSEDLTERNQGEEITERDDINRSSDDITERQSGDIAEVELLLKTQANASQESVFSLIDNPERFAVRLREALKHNDPNEVEQLCQKYGEVVIAFPSLIIGKTATPDGTLPRGHVSPEIFKSYNLEPGKNIPFEINTEEVRFIVSAEDLQSIHMDKDGKVIKNDHGTPTATGGGYGTVLTAYDIKMGEEVVVKILNQFQGNYPVNVAYFLKEGRLLAHMADIELQAGLSVRSPKARELGFLPVTADSEVLPFIVMDKMPGKTLKEEIISTREALDIGDRIAEYLDTMAENGIYNLDVKPSNILYERDTNKLSVVDWGIVRGGYRGTLMDRINDLYSTDILPMGTLSHMAPEELNEVPSEYSAQHQFAVTIFNTMNGHQNLIWAEDSTTTTNRPDEKIAGTLRMYMHIDDTQYLPKPEWMSEDVHQVFLKATRYVPEERYNSCQEFMEELRKAFDKRS